MHSRRDIRPSTYTVSLPWRLQLVGSLFVVCCGFNLSLSRIALWITFMFQFVICPVSAHAVCFHIRFVPRHVLR